MSYPGHSLKEYYPSAVMQLVYFTAPGEWTELDRESVDAYISYSY